MEPYYHDEASGITIYHGDCRDVLPTIIPGEIDLVLTDPPYGIGKAEWDDTFPTWWFDDASRIAPALGLMPGVWNIAGCPEKIGRLRYRWTLAAHLTNGMTRGRMGFGNWIPCLVYSETASSDWCRAFADWCDAQGVRRADLDRVAGTSDMGGWWASRLPHRAQIPSAAQWAKLRAAFNPPESFERLVSRRPYEPSGDCRQFVIGTEAKPDHPSPKPLPVTRWFLDVLPGDSVLDPFMGSGTTLRAAKDLGRRAIGIELEERYCEIAAKRLQQAVLPLGA